MNLMFLLFLVMFIQLHFGVNSGATRFAIERQAVNEATFRCPDEMGWKPQVRLEIGIVDMHFKLDFIKPFRPDLQVFCYIL